MRELHLFAGIGGGILGGMILGHRCVGAVEVNPYCREVLAARQRDGVLESFPILDDVRTFDGTAWRGKVDVVCGGFPCQPWSTAGKRLGTADPRHLWPEMARIVSEVRPAYVFAENVSLAAFEQPWRDLRGMGYRVPPALCLGASHVGAPHRRLRWWLLAADSASGRCGKELSPVVRGGMGDADGLREPQPQGGISDERGRPGNSGWWATEPRVGGTFDGFSSWLVRVGWIRVAHKLCSAYGDAKKVSCSQVVRELRDSLQAGHVQWEAGGRWCIPAASVLFAYLCQLAARCDQGGTAVEGEEAARPSMRSMRTDKELACSSRRWSAEQQRSGQHPDALHALPQLLAQDASAAWACYRRENANAAAHWEDGIERVARGVPSRVERLKSLGNAQVPAVAAAAFGILHRLAQ